jgi:hypothetical protein
MKLMPARGGAVACFRWPGRQKAPPTYWDGVDLTLDAGANIGSDSKTWQSSNTTSRINKSTDGNGERAIAMRESIVVVTQLTSVAWGLGM